MDPTAQSSSSIAPSSGSVPPPAGTGQPGIPSQPPLATPVQSAPMQPQAGQPSPQYANSSQPPHSGLGKGIIVGLLLLVVVSLFGAAFFFLRKPSTHSVPSGNTTQNQQVQTDQVDTSLSEFDDSLNIIETDVNSATAGLNDQPDNL